MPFLTLHCCCLTRTNDYFASHLLWRNSTFMSGKFSGLYDLHKISCLPGKSCSDYKFCVRAFARRKAAKILISDGELQKGKPLQTADMSLADESGVMPDGSASGDDYVKAVQSTVNIPSRGAVLQACTVTSGLIAALGLLLRQVCHVASMEGLPFLDCSSEVSFSFEIWHLELITGLVMFITVGRYLLLKTWSDFAESTEAANQQVLTSLQPLDYIAVAFLPGVSEELLFRGALLPLFGMDWKSVLAVATVFGVLHLGSGRKYSFAIWATFVGIMYGYATIVSSSIIVPMASHALNNLAGGILWRYTSKSLE